MFSKICYTLGMSSIFEEADLALNFISESHWVGLPQKEAITTITITTYIYIASSAKMPSRKLSPGGPRAEDMMSWVERWHKAA